MKAFTAVVLYALIWWTVLFAVLPIGTRPVAEPDRVAGGWRGAPERARMGRKFFWTTVVTTVIWAACVVVIQSGWISFRSGWLYMPDR